MKLKQLESCLDQCEGFKSPKVVLEQYTTPPAIAASIIHTIDQREQLKHKTVADFGTGPGILGIGCSLVGADFVIGIDIDPEALECAQSNIDTFEDRLGCVDLIQADILNNFRTDSFRQLFDVVVMNPPFGTKCNKGADVTFLREALNFTHNSVYSLHKSSTRNVNSQYFPKLSNPINFFSVHQTKS